MSLTTAQDNELARLLGDIETVMEELSDWEKGFVRDQITRHRTYGAEIFMSAKQWGILRRIETKYLKGDGNPEELDF